LCEEKTNKSWFHELGDLVLVLFDILVGYDNFMTRKDFRKITEF
jgi:hypothetical protein